MFPSCWDVHRASILEGRDPGFPQLTVSPHSMDGMLPPGEGNYCPGRGLAPKKLLVNKRPLVSGVPSHPVLWNKVGLARTSTKDVASHLLS